MSVEGKEEKKENPEPRASGINTGPEQHRDLRNHKMIQSPVK